MSDRIKIKTRYVIFPDDPFKKYWNNISIVVMIYIWIVLPYRVAFLNDDDGWMIPDIILDGFFTLEILISFFTVYHDENDLLIVSHKKICINYLKTWFVFDCLCAFPFENVVYGIKYSNLIKLSRLPRLYRLVRIIKLMKMLRVFKEHQKIVQPALMMGPGVQRLIVSLISLAFFCHIMCAVWYLAADVILFNLGQFHFFQLGE